MPARKSIKRSPRKRVYASKSKTRGYRSPKKSGAKPKKSRSRRPVRRSSPKTTGAKPKKAPQRPVRRASPKKKSSRSMRRSNKRVYRMDDPMEVESYEDLFTVSDIKKLISQNEKELEELIDFNPDVDTIRELVLEGSDDTDLGSYEANLLYRHMKLFYEQMDDAERELERRNYASAMRHARQAKRFLSVVILAGRRYSPE